MKASPALADLVGPMVKEVDAALKSKEKGVEEKVLAKFPQWREEMSKRQKELTSAGDEERTALLVSVLQNRQEESVEDQLAVVQSADFDGLPVAQFIVKHQDEAGEQTPLVSLALRFLDGDEKQGAPDESGVKAPAKATKEPKTPEEKVFAHLEPIVAQLEKHRASSAHVVEALEQKEDKLKDLFKKMEAQKKLTSTEGKFLERKELRKVEKRIASEKSTEKALETAITDIKKKDVKGLEEAKAALQQSMQALQAQQGEFLHFLQTGSAQAPTGSFSCPYCGAQCVEKCRSTEHKSYSACLSYCIQLNPTEGK